MDQVSRNLDEPSLLERLRRREEAAFEELVRLYGARLLATARRLLKNEEDARDAVQESFLHAHQGLDRFEGGALLSSWLHRIVVNAALMKIRSRSRRPEGSIEELLPAFDASGHQARPSRWRGDAACAAAERNEVQAIVRQKIDELLKSWRTVVILREVEGLSGEEAAAVLGTSPNAVKVRLHRARQALRTLLNGAFGKDPA